MDETLLPCPECESSRVLLECITTRFDFDEFRGLCLNCGFSGMQGTIEDKEKCIQFWNSLTRSNELSENPISTEMLEFYHTRTFARIHRVHNRAVQLACSLLSDPEEQREFLKQVLKHDLSKYSEQQYLAYVEFSWCMKHREPLSDDLKERFGVAWEHHYNNENHHPETPGKSHTRLECYEITCDLQAMADEFNEGSCRQYWENVWLPKHKWEKTDQRYLWMEQAVNKFDEITASEEDVYDKK